MNTIEITIGANKVAAVTIPQTLVEGENRTTQIVVVTPAAWEGYTVQCLLTTPKGELVDPIDSDTPIELLNTMLDGPGTLKAEFLATSGTDVERTKNAALMNVLAARDPLGTIAPEPLPDFIAQMVVVKDQASSAASQATQAALSAEEIDAAARAAEEERAAFYEGFAAGLNGRVKGTDVVTGAQADGVNTIMGHQSNAISDDVSTSIILGGGTTNYNNVIGGDGTATVGLPTPNTTTPGTGANVCVVAGYDNVAGSLSSKIISDHSMTEIGGDGHGAIYGGAYNKIKNTSGFSGIFGGKENTVSDGNFIFATGYANTVKGQGSACFGNNNAINSLGGFATGAGHTIDGLYAECHGLNNKAAGNYSRADGNYSEARFVGQQSFTGGRFAQNGDAQSSTIELHRLTTDATPAVIGILNTATPIVLKPNQAMAFSALVVAKAIGALDSAAFRVEGLAFRGATGQSYINSPIVTVLGKSAGAAAWASDALGSSVGGLCIRGTGAAGKSIRWVVRLEVTEVVSE